MIRISIHYFRSAGAERGAIVLCKSEGVFIEALLESRGENSNVIVESGSLESFHDLPLSLIAYACKLVLNRSISMNRKVSILFSMTHIFKLHFAMRMVTTLIA